MRGRAVGARPSSRRSLYPVDKLARAEEREAELWHELIHVRRHVSRQAYDSLAARLPVLKPRRVRG